MKDCLQAACDEAGAQLEIELRTNYVSYRVPEDSDTVKMVLDAAERVGVKGFTALGGGGSDANIFNRNGIEAVVLGTGMTKVHTTEEILKIENLNNIAELAFQLLTAE